MFSPKLRQQLGIFYYKKFGNVNNFNYIAFTEIKTIWHQIHQ
jgi:hypothetical protein